MITNKTYIGRCAFLAWRLFYFTDKEETYGIVEL